MSDTAPVLPPRDPRGHKGTFGTVLVVGGQAAEPRVMLGGPAFAAVGALRAGAGLAVLAVPAPLMVAALTIAPSATGIALPVDHEGDLVASSSAAILDEILPSVHALVIGPGLGAAESVRQLTVRLAGREAIPMVIDADALNALSRTADLQRDLRAPVVLTPHPGEYRRLASSLGISLDPVEADQRPRAAEALAQRLGCIVVLKGAGTVVSDGHRTWTAATGNAALATGGSGDVLSGVIGSMIAQFARGSTPLTLFDCACLGVHIHGLAADHWAAAHGAAGMLALELAESIPGALAALRADRA